MTVAFLDVHYPSRGARAACVLAASWEAPVALATWAREIDAVAPYRPGSFYLRELPCLLAVLQLLPAPPNALVIDGYVWLPGDMPRLGDMPNSRDVPGLGAHLYQAQGGAVPVVGIAKTPYAGVERSAAILPVLRGRSNKPLYVTAAGLEVAAAAARVRQMAGAHRVPALVQLADALARGTVRASSE
jgi:deoxyribonuclease V